MFGQNFVRIKTNYSINLIDTNIKLSDYKENKFRSTLLQNTTSVQEIPNRKNAFYIEVPRTLFYKSISSEFEQYHVRSLLQLSDFNKMDEKINDSWKYTTFYYFFFFSNVALHRYLQKGYIYLDQSNAKTLSQIFSAILRDPVSIEKGNWYFQKKSETLSNVQIELKKVGGNVHQMLWQDLKRTLKQFEEQSSRKGNTEENSILKNIYELLKTNKNFSPSELRNYLNYVSEISIYELDNKILCPKIKTTDFIKNLSKYHYNKSNLSQIQLSIFLGQYIHSFNNAIIKDIELRDSRSFKLKKKYTRLKEN